MSNIFENYWNNMFVGNAGLEIYQNSLDLSSCYTEQCISGGTTQYYKIGDL